MSIVSPYCITSSLTGKTVDNVSEPLTIVALNFIAVVSEAHQDLLEQT